MLVSVLPATNYGQIMNFGPMPIDAHPACPAACLHRCVRGSAKLSLLLSAGSMEFHAAAAAEHCRKAGV